MAEDADLLGKLVDAIPVGVVIWRVEDPQDAGKLRMVRPNRHASIASGAELSGFVGLTMEEAFPAFVATGLPAQILETAFHGGETLDMGRIEYGDDNVVQGTYAVSAFRLDDEHVVVQYRNVTEEELLIQKLARANEELEAFAYFASHDLQAPARQVMAFCELVMESAALDDASRGYLTYAIDASERMGVLIRDLLGYARAERGPLRLVAVRVDAMLRSAADDLQTELEGCGAQLELPSTEAEVLAPEGLGGMVVFNLLSNAVKFRRPGVAPRVEVRVSRDAEQVRIDVSDNGIGFDPADMEAVFTPFERLVATSSYPGSGLGLAFCSRVLARSGGRMEATSVPGEGSTFSVWFRGASVS